MHDDLLIAEVADNSLHMSTCGLHLSLQIETHHNSNSCREWKWAAREQFRSCIFLDRNLHYLVLLCYYFFEMLLQFYHSTRAPSYIRYYTRLATYRPVIKVRSSGTRSRRRSRETSWRDPVMDRAKDKLAHISIGRNIYLSRRCQLTFLQKYYIHSEIHIFISNRCL